MDVRLAIFTVCFVCVAAHATVRLYDGWAVKSGETPGQVVLTRSETDGPVPFMVEIVAGPDPRPVSVEIRYGEEVTPRPGTPGESRLFWVQRRAHNAFWSFLKDNGNLECTDPSVSRQIPRTWLGRTGSVVSQAGARHAGVYGAVGENEEWFSLTMDGAPEPVRFYTVTVKEACSLR